MSAEQGEAATESGCSGASSPPPMALLVHPARWGLPSACPECLRACAYLLLAHVPHSQVPCPAHITGDLPVLEDYSAAPPAAQPSSSSSSSPGPAPKSAAARRRGPVVVQPSSFTEGGGGLPGYLRTYRGIDLDASLTAAERGELVALRALVESYLDAALEQEIWAVPENRGAMEELFRAALPWPVSRIVLWQQQQQHAKRLLGGATGRSGEEASEGGSSSSSRPQPQTMVRALEAYGILSERLGRGDLFFADRPTSLDAALYSHLAFLLRAPLKKSALKDKVIQLPGLSQYMHNMERRLKKAEQDIGKSGNVDEAFLPFTRVPPLKSMHSDQSKAEEENRLRKEKASRRGGQLFLLGQLGAIATYIFFSLVSLDIGVHEHDEEEGDEMEVEEEDDDDV